MNEIPGYERAALDKFTTSEERKLYVEGIIKRCLQKKNKNAADAFQFENENKDAK